MKKKNKTAKSNVWGEAEENDTEQGKVNSF